MEWEQAIIIGLCSMIIGVLLGAIFFSDNTIQSSPVQTIEVCNSPCEACRNQVADLYKASSDIDHTKFCMEGQNWRLEVCK